jgi:hypothetical protein
MLEDPVDERMGASQAASGRRRDHAPSRLEKVLALPEEVVRIAIQASMLGGSMAYLLAITTAWTGCRWGEITGFQRDQVALRRGVITIDPEIGRLHESAHSLRLDIDDPIVGPHGSTPAVPHRPAQALGAAHEPIHVHGAMRRMAPAQRLQPARVSAGGRRCPGSRLVSGQAWVALPRTPA